MQFCTKQLYGNCEIWVQLLFLIPSGRYSSETRPLHPIQNVQDSNSIGMQPFIIIVTSYRGRGGNQRLRSSKRSLSAKKINVTILILSSMVKTPCSYGIWLQRYLAKTIPYK